MMKGILRSGCTNISGWDREGFDVGNKSNRNSISSQSTYNQAESLLRYH